MMADLDAMRVKIAAIGAQMLFIPNPPQSSSRSGWTAAILAKHFDWRNQSAEYCRDNNVPYFDWNSANVSGAAVINPTDANGNPATGILQADGIHPTRKGVFSIAKPLADWFNAVLPYADRLVTSVADTTNLINGLFTGTGGTAVGGGTVADSWTTTRSGTSTLTESIAARTVAADGDAIGSNQVLTISAAASGATVTLTSTTVHSQISAGDRLDVLGHLQVSGAVDLVDLRMSVVAQSGTTLNKNYYEFSRISTTEQTFTDTLNGVFELLPEYRSTANGAGAPTVCSLAIQAYFGTSGAGACTIKLGRASLRKVV
jgi:hypothetical protein